MANNNFNDIVAQLYDQEFKTQEEAKYEHIRQAKEKALEEQRVEAEKRAEADRIAREHDKATEQLDTERTQEVSGKDENEGAVPNEAINGNVGADWSSVSPQDYLDKAVSIYQSSGGTAWATL